MAGKKIQFVPENVSPSPLPLNPLPLRSRAGECESFAFASHPLNARSEGRDEDRKGEVRVLKNQHENIIPTPAFLPKGKTVVLQAGVGITSVPILSGKEGWGGLNQVQEGARGKACASFRKIVKFFVRPGRPCDI